MRLAAADHCGLPDRPLWRTPHDKLNVSNGQSRLRTSLPWFLPGRNRIRGGAARRFASVGHFHRGSQAEATSQPCAGIRESDQRLAESRSGRGGFPAGSQRSHLRGSQAARIHSIEAVRWGGSSVPRPPLSESGRGVRRQARPVSLSRRPCNSARRSALKSPACGASPRMARTKN